MKKLNFNQNYPNGGEYEFVGIYEQLKTRKGAFIDLFYEEFDTTSIKSIYLEFVYNEIRFIVNRKGYTSDIPTRIFIVKSDDTFHLISNNYVPIISTITKYLRISKIEDLL